MVVSGSDAIVSSEGIVNAWVFAGKDLAVWAGGDILGSYSAARDATTVTHGDFNASLTADRDIGVDRRTDITTPGVWAAGDITGNITAGRNIGGLDILAFMVIYEDGVRSFGNIDANIQALNTTSSTGGGYIGNVAANGTIDGTIWASTKIENVRAGGAIGATITAPIIGSVVDFDSVTASSVPPAPPASAIVGILNNALVARNAVLAQRQGILDTIPALLADVLQAQIDAVNSVSDTRAEVMAKNDKAKQKAKDALQADKDRFDEGVKYAQQVMQQGLDLLESQIAGSKRNIQRSLDATQRDSQTRIDAWNAMVSKLADQLAKADAEMVESKGKFGEGYDTVKTFRDENWTLWIDPKRLFQTLYPPKAPIEPEKVVLTTASSYGAVGLGELATQRIEGGERAKEHIGEVLGVLPGVNIIYFGDRLINGRDAFSGRKLSHFSKTGWKLIFTRD